MLKSGCIWMTGQWRYYPCVHAHASQAHGLADAVDDVAAAHAAVRVVAMDLQLLLLLLLPLPLLLGLPLALLLPLRLPAVPCQHA